MNMMETLKIDDDTPIDAKILSGAIENAQKKVESRNFQARKNTLEYDDVMNVQREVIYKQRRQVLDGENLRAVHPQHDPPLDRHLHPRPPGREQAPAPPSPIELATEPFRGLFFPPDQFQYTDEDLAKQSPDALVEELDQAALAVYDARGEPHLGDAAHAGAGTGHDAPGGGRILDGPHRRHGRAEAGASSLRAYAQTNPVDAYKKEGFEMFEAMIQAIQEETIRRIILARVQTNEVQPGAGGQGHRRIRRQ